MYERSEGSENSGVDLRELQGSGEELKREKGVQWRRGDEN